MTYWQASLIPIFENGIIKYVVELTKDITESVKNRKTILEQAEIIKKKNRQLEAIIENMSDALLVFDKEGKYNILNKAARDRFLPLFPDLDKIGDGRRKNEYYDMDGKLISLEDAPSCRVARGERLDGFRFAIKTEDSFIYQSLNGTPLYDKNGNFTAGLICCQDITEKLKNETLIQTQQELILKSEIAKNAALENSIKMKDEFLATITHEFKTPLTVINAALQVIESNYGSQISDSIKKHLQRIRINSFRQLRLVNNLLDITRFDSGHLKIQEKNLDIVFLSRSITQSVDLYAKQKGLDLKFISETDYAEMAIDEEKFERILLNLLSNAIKFTPRGKSVSVIVSCNNMKVTIKVKDEGIGIPRSKQKLIFERFGQVDSSLSRQAEGTGIGLSLVKTLVTGIGGTITLSSSLNMGSTFTVTLPVRKIRNKDQNIKSIGSQNSRIMQAVAIEFSDMYLD